VFNINSANIIFQRNLANIHKDDCKRFVIKDAYEGRAISGLLSFVRSQTALNSAFLSTYYNGAHSRAFCHLPAALQRQD